MNKNILKISLLPLLGAALLSTGCIKEATLTSGATEDQVTLETNIEGIPAALVKAGSTGYSEPWDFSLPAIHLATDSMTGDLVIAGNSGYDWFSQWGSNIALGADYAVGALTWNNYYKWIMSANSVIGIISGNDVADLTAAQRKNLGFAYTYRAMFYFDLVRLYEFKKNKYTEGDNVLGLGVPIVLPETTEAEAKKNPRAKVSDIYDTVIFPDLDNAEELLSTWSTSDKYSISLAAVYALKARAYLERATALEEAGDADAAQLWKNAAEYARKAITASGCTPLTQEQWEDPKTGFNSATSNNAWIWGLALPSESVSNLLCFTAHMSTENSWSAYGYEVCRSINRNLYNSISDYDFRKHSWLNPDRTVYDYKSCREDSKTYFKEKLKDYANIKFRPAQGNYSEYKIGGAADHCLIRVEEMYFIEAEARAHEDLAEGVRLLNEFMNSWRMTGGVKYDCTNRSASLSSFVNELILQKRIEFWGEGIVMFDMKRLDISSKRGYVGTNASASYRINCEGRAPYWNFVISRGEVQNNPAIQGWNNPDPSNKVPLWTN